MQLILPSTLENDPLECSKALEQGNILFFPQVPFAFSAGDRQSLLAAVQTSSGLHKNIAYRPLQDRVSGLDNSPSEVLEKVRTSLSHFSQATIAFLSDLLPHYARSWRLDYASFRGIEEQGRDLAWKKRNDLLHTDAFPTRPTNGDLILRFFVNINPSKTRAWVTSDPFAKLAAQYASDAGLNRIAAGSSSPLRRIKKVAHSLGLPITDRSPYDQFMLGFHDFLKSNAEYQQNCVKYRFEFPPNSAWMVFTDVVPHAVLSGQYAVEQTFLIDKDSLTLKDLAPVRILEGITRRPLTQ